MTLTSFSFALPENELKQKSTGCETKKSPEHCIPVAYHFEELKNYNKSLHFYDLGCTLKDEDACRNANDLRNRMCFAEAITSECGKAPIEEKFKFFRNSLQSDFNPQTEWKSINKFIQDENFRKAFHKYSKNAETSFICSVTQLISLNKEYDSHSIFVQNFGSQLMANNPKGFLSCISKLDLKQLKKMKFALISNPFENWYEDAKFAGCQDNECIKNVVNFYNQQIYKLKQVENSPEIKKDTVDFYSTLLRKEIQEIKKKISKE